MRPACSVVLRTSNEGMSLRRLLPALRLQDFQDFELVLVDSASADDTRAVAETYGARIVTIAPVEFTYGRALNLGCEAARGEFCVIVSAHCLPANDQWLTRLLRGFRDPGVGGTYGRQLPAPTALPYEERNFLLGFPPEHRRQTSHYFFHNANSAVRRDVWGQVRFDERLPGLEDRDWARRALAVGYEIVYEPLAMVYHWHRETLGQIYWRSFREGVALVHLDPTFRQSFARFMLNYLRAVQRDLLFVRRYHRPASLLLGALPQRFFELYGTYRGVKVPARPREAR